MQDYYDTLDTLHIEYDVVRHPHLETPPEVQSHLGLTLADGLSTMILKTAKGYVAVLRRCDTRLDSKKLKRLVGSKMRMASPEEFVAVTGVPVGAARAVNPGLPTFLDEALFEKEFLVGGSGSFTQSIRYKSSSLKHIPNATIADLCQK